MNTTSIKPIYTTVIDDNRPLQTMVKNFMVNSSKSYDISKNDRNELNYEPEKWNGNFKIRSTHNCYAYAMNDFNPNRGGFPQPGVKAGLGRPDQSDFVCPKINKRVLADNPNLKPISDSENCPFGMHKVALVVDPYRDYHFYRQDSNGLWSHKPGSRPVINYDDSGNLITNPRYADRNYETNNLDYSNYCMTFCAPYNSRVY